MVEPLPPHVIVLFGATGDLAKRKLLPGLGYLQQSRFTPDVRLVGTAMEDLSTDDFRALAKSAIDNSARTSCPTRRGPSSPRSSPTSRRAQALRGSRRR